jgi:pyruvate oxidase
MPEIATLACQNAISKNGVAHINIPSNVSVMRVPHFESKEQIIRTKGRVVPAREDLTEASKMINRSERPLILAGAGAREAAGELLEFAETIHAPIIKALRGKDILPDMHPQVLGGIGLLGTEPSSHAVKHCDLFISIGSDFPYGDFYPDSSVPTIQIDNDADQIGRRHVVTCPLNGDARLTLRELLPLVRKKENDDFLTGCKEKMQKWISDQNKIELSTDDPIHPQRVARLISDLAAHDAVICCDTGAVTVWGARNFRIRDAQKFILSGDLASMAFGLPAAIGAQLVYQGRQVIAMCGDGGFAMLMCDFVTAVKYKLPVKIFVFNNGKLGLIQMEQEAKSGNPEWETDLSNPDYAAFAKICGGVGFSVRNQNELEPAIKAALVSPGPCVVDVHINPAEITWPPHVTFKEAGNYIRARITEEIIHNK